MKLALWLLGGSVGGYVWHRVVGCRTGTCPISANPYVSTLYGALMGYFLSRGP